jgi:FtsH-binding integral membrane protein
MAYRAVMRYHVSGKFIMGIIMKNRGLENSQFSEIAKKTISYDAGLRTYFVKVFTYLTLGLGICAAVAVTSFGWYTDLLLNGYVNPFIPLVLWFVVSMCFTLALPRLSFDMARLLFFADVALFGLVLSPICAIYTPTSVVATIFVTASMFLSMIIYGYTTEKDLSSIGPILFMGFIGLILAGIANLFMRSSAFALAISGVGVVIITAYIAYTMQIIKSHYSPSDSQEVYNKKVISGASIMFHEFMNLFLHLLRFIGRRN